jgi:hypothetical protein
MKLTFGSDPEFMLVKNNQYYSAIGIVKGTKDSRISCGGHEFYYDNVLAECGIAPGGTKKEVLNNFQECFKLYAKIVAPYKLVPQASQIYPANQMNHTDARNVGCKIEWCAYAMTDIEDEHTERTIKKTNFRSAGGHVHLGANMLKDQFNQIFTVRMLDLFLGIPSIFLDHDSTSAARKKLYGKAGRHRRPAHGLEYRTLGNFWLASPRLVGLVYDICEFVVQFVHTKQHLEFWSIDDDWATRPDWANAHHCNGYNVRSLRSAIDKTNLRQGEKFLRLVEEHLPVPLMEEFQKLRLTKHYDFYKEWSL